MTVGSIACRPSRSKWLIWAASLGLVACAAAPAPAPRDPEVVLIEGHPRLAMPQELQRAIAAACPGMRPPLDSEIIGRWARNISATSLPYAAWGDYDGNGLTDVAIVLLNETEWRFVIFNQVSAGTYNATYKRVGKRDRPRTSQWAPEGITLRTIPKGENIYASPEPEDEASEETALPKDTRTFDRDVVSLIQLDEQEDLGGAEILYWQTSGYVSLDLTGD